MELKTALFLSLVFRVDSWVINNVHENVLLKNNDVNYNFKNDPDMDPITFHTKFSLIYPGTKWCGMGDIADNYDDLGTEREADICCREHDNCPSYILSGDTKFNLTNDVFYTRLSCKCDEQFRQCLKRANSKAAANVGHVYFDLIITKCYRREHPVIRCIKKGGILYKKCLEHAYDLTAEKIFQWFDVRNFNDP